MRCPYCQADDTKVVDSRLASAGASVRRRRECLSCTERFTTFETAELMMPRIIKNDGVREPFDEEKLRRGMSRALEKRPVAIEDIDSALDSIKYHLHRCGERELPSSQLGAWVMDALRELDEVAYVRFASVYQQFQNIDDFRQELDRLQEQPDSLPNSLIEKEAVADGV